MKFLRQPPPSTCLTPSHPPPAKRRCERPAESDQGDLPVDDENSEEKAILAMEEEMSKKKKNSKELCKLMEVTYSKRQQWIRDEMPPVQEIMEVYLALKNSKVVSVCLTLPELH